VTSTEAIGAVVIGNTERATAAGDDGLGGTGRTGATDGARPSAPSGRAPVARFGAGGGTGNERVPLGAGGGAALGSLLCGRESRLGAGGGTLRRGARGGFGAVEVDAAAGPGPGGGWLREGRGGAGAAETRGTPGVSLSAGAALRRGAAGGIEFGRGRGGAGFFGEGDSSAMTLVS